MTGGALVSLTAPGKPGETSELALDRYDNEHYSLRIAKGPGALKQLSDDYSQQEASVSILDASGKQLYRARGTLSCGA
jgi:hypothetical protein